LGYNILSRNTRGCSSLIYKRERQREREVRRRFKPAAGDGAEEDEAGCAMVPLAARNLGSTRHWSSGGDVGDVVVLPVGLAQL